MGTGLIYNGGTSSTIIIQSCVIERPFFGCPAFLRSTFLNPTNRDGGGGR